MSKSALSVINIIWILTNTNHASFHTVSMWAPTPTSRVIMFWSRQDLNDVFELWSYGMNKLLVLIHWGWDKIASILHISFPNVFSCMKIYEFCFRFHWSLFLRFQLTIFQHWFRLWLGHRIGAKPLPESTTVNLLMHICVTWPQWVKVSLLFRMKQNLFCSCLLSSEIITDNNVHNGTIHTRSFASLHSEWYVYYY